MFKKISNGVDKKVYKIVIFTVFVFAFLAIIPSADAANLYFSPSSGAYTVGKTIPLNVYVRSTDQAMNAASGAISFPKDKLEVASISKAGSIISLWVEEPSFSNSAGTVSFEGIVLNPGWTGTNGKIININFRTKVAGTAIVNFSSGSVLANDGVGTNILANLENAEFNLGGAVPAPITSYMTPGAPSMPFIFSSTHPDSNKWYTKKDAKFTWSTPSDVTSLRFLVSKNPSAIPNVNSLPIVNEKELKDMADGVWYLHAQFRNSIGWGEIAHFRFQIDTVPPEPFTIKFVDDKEMLSNLNPKIIFGTTDSLSGISYYKIKINEDEFFSVTAEVMGTDPYILSLKNPGKQNILIQAFDKAGNYSIAFDEFTVLALQAPVFTEYPKELRSDQVLIVKGKTIYPNSQVSVWLKKEKEEPKNYAVRAEQDGKFAFINEEKLKDGILELVAEVSNNGNAKSLPSDTITIVVTKPIFLRIGSWIISFLGVIIPLIILIIALLFVIWYGWHKFLLFKKKLREEVRKTESTLYRDFELLKENMKEQVKMLEETKTKRSLTEEETTIVEHLKRDLNDTEKFVRNKIEELEKDIS